MIDCHAHAFPALGEHFDRALDKVSPDAAFVVRDALDDLRGAAGRIASTLRRVPLPAPLGIERVAALGKRLPEPIWRRVESAVALGLAPRIALSGSVDRLLASMDATGIERTVVIAARNFAGNEWLLKEAWPRARAQLVPVAILPDVATDGSREQWAEAFDALAEKGAAGFKIHPNADGLPADHAAYGALFEVAERRKRFVILHTGCFHVPGMKRSGAVDPAAFEALFEKHPQVRVCLAHMNREHPEGAWELMQRHEQLFADTSWQPAQAVSAAIERVGARRLLLGSDWPLLHAGLQSDALEILKRAASDTDFERVTQYTPRVFLGEA